MLDSENRAEAARYFLERARDDSLTDTLHVWYAQATVIFGIATIENLAYDYAERKTGRPQKGQNLSFETFEQELGSQTNFYRWLQKELHQNDLYQFLRAERNKIVHRGEPDKKRSGKGKWTTTSYFAGLAQKSVDQVCQEFCDWVSRLLADAKRSYPELASGAS